MIEINNVTKSYNGKTNAVDNISLQIENGQIFGFLGPNGAGKTTTIKMITGILSPDQGTVVVNGHDIVKDPIKAKRSFGFVPDDPNIFPRLKGIEYLKFMGDLYEVPAVVRKERIAKLTARFGLETAMGDKIQSYSHGMRQKLLVIGALLHDPDVWILDEPMTGLDPKSSFELKEMMREHAGNGKTVFFSTHVLEVAEKVCDKIAVIDKGKILFSGTIDEMREHFHADESLEQMFLELTNDDNA
jgi:ABC-2 type transport system ATP-binding protein